MWRSPLSKFEGPARIWWTPIGADDFVAVTEDVMSYEVEGELRLAESMDVASISFEVADESEAEQ